MADFACFKFHSGIQESSLAKYPFHLIRNKWLVRVPRWHRILLTLYSSSPLISSGVVTESWCCGWSFHNKVIRGKHGRQDEFFMFLEVRVNKQ